MREEGKGFYLLSTDSVVAALSRGDTKPQPKDESSCSTVIVFYASSLRQSDTITLVNVVVGWGTSG